VSRSQLKLTAALVALICVVIAAAGGLASLRLEHREVERAARDLSEQARVLASLSGDAAFTPEHAAQLDALADREGRILGRRVTLIAPDGSVVGDSGVPHDRLAGLENHRHRPEVASALAGGVGRSERRSSTVGRPLLHVAAPTESGGVVRLAMNQGELEAAVAEVRHELVVAGGVGLLAAIALGFTYAWLTMRPLRELQRLTAAIVDGDLETRVPRHFSDETAQIARSIQRLAEQLRERLVETTEEKERLQAVLDGMAEGVLVIDTEGSIVIANGRIQEFFGLRSEPVGKSTLEGIRHAELAELLADARHTGEPRPRAISVVHPLPRTLRVQAVCFPRGSGEPIGTVAVFHDVTELTRLETMRRDFVANASHELRTPLAAIRGFAETLLGTPEISDTDRRSYLGVIDRHARRLGNLVGDLLELSKIESGKTGFELVAVDTAQLAESVIADTRGRFEEKGLSVTRDVKGESVAWADAAALEQILTNLLDNAVKYSEADGRIHLSIEGDLHTVTIRVQDTGLGIPEADLGRIFERFYRVDKARSRRLGGTGLGLAIVKHLVQTLGGDIWVESDLGRGSTFSVTLPRAPS